VHNNERTLSASIASTLRALGPHDELLIGLHNCTDGSRDVAEEFTSDPRVHIISVSGEGLASVLNKLIEESRFSLVARMDADDLCLPWRFSVQKRVFKAKRCDFLFSTAIVSWRKKRLRLLVPQAISVLEPQHVTSLLRGANPLVHPTMLAKKSWLEKLGGYQNVAGEDLDLWLRATILGARIVRLATPTIVYNLSENQLSSKKWYLDGVSTSSEIRKHREEIISLLGNYKLSLREKIYLIWPPLPQNMSRVNEFQKLIKDIGSDAQNP